MVIAIDFDGTIVEHKYPKIGKEIPNAFKTIRQLIEQGHTVILWTYRSGEELDEAVKLCKKNGIEFHAINNNDPDEDYDNSYSRKIYADIYIDDRNLLGLPDWLTISKMLNNK